MASRLVALVLLAAAAGRPAAGARLFDSRCPPQGFDALPADQFDLDAYIAERWYVQKQMPVVYQPRSNLFCVVAQYEPLDASNPAAGLLVNNYSNRQRVNGEPQGTSGVGGGPRTIATIPDPARPSKLRVGIAPFGSGSLASRMLGRGGDYWVVAAGQSADPAEQTGGLYDWAIVSGGAPSRPVRGGGCATGSRLGLLRRFSTNNVGLWLFSRKPVDPINTQLMLSKLAELGLDASELVDVQQEGCLYEGAPGGGSAR